MMATAGAIPTKAGGWRQTRHSVTCCLTVRSPSNATVGQPGRDDRLGGRRGPSAVAAGTEDARGAPGAVHDQQQFLREAVRIPGPRTFRELAEAIHDRSLVLGGNAVPGVVRLGELTGRPDERATQALGA